jgi:hypothetical protein
MSVFFLNTERFPGLDVICGSFNDAVKPVDIVRKRDDVLIMYITVKRMEDGLGLTCDAALSVSVILSCTPIRFCHFVIQPVSSSYCVIQPCQFQLLCDTALSVPVIV